MSSISTFLYVFFLLFSCTNAFNITEILTQYKDFSSFNDLLTKTQLAPEINTRNTITILAVENSIIASLSGTPPDVLKKVLSVHIILDYYDLVKLQKLTKGTATLTTLFQSSGQAKGKEGFLNATVTSSGGGVVLASEAPGSPPGANVVKSVVSQPYNVSVLQVSHAIVPMGIDGSKSNSNSSSNSSSSATAPAASPKVAPATAPATSPSTSPAPSSDVAASPSTPPTGAPNAGAPATGDPAADAPAADAPASDGNKKSNGVAIGLGTIGVIVIIASLILSLASMI